LHRKFLYIIGLAALLLASGNDAQAAPGTATASIGTAIGFNVLSELAFGTLVPDAGGTVIIDPDQPDATSRSSTGAVIRVSSDYHPALITVTGDSHSNSTYQVTIPQTPRKITNPEGKQMAVTLSISSNIDKDKKGKFDINHNGSFKIGGTLTVGKNQAQGVYRGTFVVMVNY